MKMSLTCPCLRCHVHALVFGPVQTPVPKRDSMDAPLQSARTCCRVSHSWPHARCEDRQSERVAVHRRCKTVVREMSAGRLLPRMRACTLARTRVCARAHIWVTDDKEGIPQDGAQMAPRSQPE